MEQILERLGCAHDPVVYAFARVIEAEFFVGKHDILVDDEGTEQRACLVAASAIAWIEQEQGRGAPARAVVFTSSSERAARVASLLEAAGTDCAVSLQVEDLAHSREKLAAAACVVMSPEAFLEAAKLEGFQPRSFGLAILEDGDIFAERPSEFQRRLWGHLLPPWQRRGILFAARQSIRVRNTAIDFADNPRTVVLRETEVRLAAIPSTFVRVEEGRKFRFLLGRLAENPRGTVVFCNLRQTAREIEARLKLNHFAAERMSVVMPEARRKEILRRFEESQSETADQHPIVLVISNDNLEIMPADSVLHALHYDIPLEPSIYLERMKTVRKDCGRNTVMVCERYAMGLAAIQTQLRRQVEIADAAETDYAAEDLSEGIDLMLEKPASREPRREFRGEPRSESRHREGSRRQAFAGAPGSPAGKHEDVPVHRKRQERVAQEEHRLIERQKDRTGIRKSDRLQREMPEATLYSMSSEERLAYFRTKYRGILHTPASEHPADEAGKQAQQPEGRKKRRKHGSKNRPASPRNQGASGVHQDAETIEHPRSGPAVEHDGSAQADSLSRQDQPPTMHPVPPDVSTEDESAKEGTLKKLFGGLFRKPRGA